MGQARKSTAVLIGLDQNCRAFGAAGGGRTRTLFRARDFKSLVSAYSTTAA